MTDWIDVSPAEDLRPGDWKTVEVDDVLVAVFNVDGEFYAIEDTCTHDGGILTGGCIDGMEIECPRHGARFNIKTGEVLSAPAYEDVDVLPVRIEAGIIQVRDDRWD